MQALLASSFLKKLKRGLGRQLGNLSAHRVHGPVDARNKSLGFRDFSLPPPHGPLLLPSFPPSLLHNLIPFLRFPFLLYPPYPPSHFCRLLLRSFTHFTLPHLRGDSYATIAPQDALATHPPLRRVAAWFRRMSYSSPGPQSPRPAWEWVADAELAVRERALLVRACQCLPHNLRMGTGFSQWGSKDAY